MQQVTIVDASQIVDIQIHFKVSVVSSKIDAQNRNLGVDKNASLHLKLMLILEKQTSNFAQRLESKPKIVNCNIL
jgi:hypothetical protein